MFFKNTEKKIDYGNVLESYEGLASFQEKDGKAYPSFKYTNTSEKTVLIKKAKLVVYKVNSKDVLTKEELNLHVEVAPGKSKTIKFKKLDKKLEEMSEYYPEVIVE